jgi:hypothetical protein
MLPFSQSFAQASEHLMHWIEAVLGEPPELASAGTAATRGGVALTPWRIDNPETAQREGRLVYTATGRFCASIGPEAPAFGCDWLDRLYVAALAEGCLSADDPPEQYWRNPPALYLTLERRIEWPAETSRAGPVTQPVIVDITTNPAHRARERN